MLDGGGGAVHTGGVHADLYLSLRGRRCGHVVLRPGQRFWVGRADDVSLRVPDPKVSRRHAELELDEAGLFVTDRSSNGTFLEGLRLQRDRRVRVAPGAVLRLGDHELRHALHGCVEDQRSYTAQLRLGDGALFAPGEIELLELIGEGANGRVWAALQPAARRRVAVKIYAPHDDADATGRRRFLREGELATRVRGPNVTEVYDVRIVGDTPVIVMELVQGPSAADRVADGPLPLGEALRIGEDVARAMCVAEEQGVVHRDIKPHNILLDPSGRAKLSDFGLAKGAESATLTVKGQGMGSLHYAAPEQVRDATSADHRTDLYGLGATLYHLIAGVPLFGLRARGLVESIRLIRKVDPPPLIERRPDCPPAVAEVVHGLLRKQPADRRPATFRELAARLAALRAAHAPPREGGGAIYETADG